MSQEIEDLKREIEALQIENKRLRNRIKIEEKIENEINKAMKSGCHKNTCYF